ncbi:chitinase domain protein [Legionella birminghamensis]|uniref:Chitinase domain protein n=1 Tax=Legionella birminghamensis TaxID=28083 RepID=A0A378I670_9GAMM|nr:chitinase [Legionella birminghamensis]KTC72526.1 chitinase domain protein [Legionella birminghamensis]STX30659.1 chitinase domain protein [Legionella birminghamensis]
MINKITGLLISVCTPLAAFAHPLEDAATPPFSPYADMTINTYWDPDYQSIQPMDLSKIATEQDLKAFRLAFITDSGHCQPAWGGHSGYLVSNKWGQHLTDKLMKNNIDISISFGGALGTDLSMNCNVEQLKLVLSKVSEIYHAKSLDFDVENNTADAPTLIQALQIFQQQNPEIKIIFTLPVLPEGLTSQGKELIEMAKATDLIFNVNIMAMDYGAAYTGDMGDYAIASANALRDELRILFPKKSEAELWSMIEITPMIGVNDINTEQFTLDNAKKLREFAISKSIGGLSMWSIARDKPCPDKWASPICSGNNLQKQAYEYTQQLK